MTINQGDYILSPQEMEHIILSPKDIQKMLKCGDKTVYDLFADATFPSFRVGAKHYILYSQFIFWCKEQSKPRKVTKM